MLIYNVKAICSVVTETITVGPHGGRKSKGGHHQNLQDSSS